MSTAEVYLDRISDICGELPETSATGSPHPTYTVRGRAFAWFLDDHHGDGRLAVAVAPGPGWQQKLVARGPERYYVPRQAAGRGWVALRLDRPGVDWAEVGELLRRAYRAAAPEHLAAQVRVSA
ncbi:MmcQ/YjbR family DNA-binding protein [Spirilliplanes yamanashiensis]|uniref:MmcQ/YjbR family DNA-binding protein n=1 Tax=Spirilliplanes yamanashiensis TaxID=42233 RepID=A0A8J3YAV8_9ACTN|nr:MmcQ/YjbR family DNA-binding protein [Spirilliplanes yamanashiensis]MDP9818676.1 hypothetical protein [Spirilliplanes yamanashiensis]GIJ05133.1 hypothetical protein Sya03_44850 [Spirilliplanes yamanashiensis]